jgi:hypothetical protein
MVGKYARKLTANFVALNAEVDAIDGNVLG